MGSGNVFGATSIRFHPWTNPSRGMWALLILSNIRTPSCISLTIKDLDSWNIWSSSFFHLNGVPGLRSAQDGSIRSVAVNANKN